MFDFDCKTLTKFLNKKMYFRRSGNKNVRLFDIRQNAPLASWAVEGDVTSMAIHSSADLLAW